MANFFSDLFNSFTGQRAVPTRNFISPQQGLTDAFGIAQGLVPQYASLNQALQPVQTGLQLANEAQIYGPQANQLRQGTYQSILDQLNLGESLSPELTADITRKLFESGAATGFGASTAGRGNVILQTGLEGERRGQQRRAAALQAANLLPTSSFQFQPTGFPDVGGIYQNLQQQNQVQDAFQNEAENIRRENFTSLLNTGGRLLGFGLGAAFPQLGAASAAASLIGGPQFGIGGAAGAGGILANLFRTPSTTSSTPSSSSFNLGSFNPTISSPGEFGF